MKNETSLLLFALPLSLALAACGYDTPPPRDPEWQGQTYQQAMQMFCEVDRFAGVVADEDPFEVGRKRTEWIRTNIENPDGIYLRTAISVKPPAEQAADIRQEAKEQGLASCALADDLEKTGMGGIAP